MRRLPIFLLIAPCSSAVAQTRSEVIKIVSALIDSEKLATLKVEQRAVNARFKKLLYHLYRADAEGNQLEDIVAAAYPNAP